MGKRLDYDIALDEEIEEDLQFLSDLSVYIVIKTDKVGASAVQAVFKTYESAQVFIDSENNSTAWPSQQDYEIIKENIEA